MTSHDSNLEKTGRSFSKASMTIESKWPSPRSNRDWMSKLCRESDFLDIGSGSGLFSLAARRLGASVHSFDYDPHSVACTQELRERYFKKDPSWKVERGDALDCSYLGKLGTFDIVYSWGVLHHTGKMWEALENVVPLVAEGGTLWLAIYNDQGRASRYWTTVKRTYNKLPRQARFLISCSCRHGVLGAKGGSRCD